MQIAGYPKEWRTAEIPLFARFFCSCEQLSVAVAVS
jgi:hypothetical protein